MAHRKNHHWLFDLGLILIVAGVYFLAAKLGLSLAFLNASVSPVWPPTGVAIAIVFWLGYRGAPGVLLVALWILSATIYTDLFLRSAAGRPWGHVTIPLLLWAAFRFGPRGVATTIATFSGIAIWGTVHGRGVFAVYNANDALLYLQAYV